MNIHAHYDDKTHKKICLSIWTRGDHEQSLDFTTWLTVEKARALHKLLGNVIDGVPATISAADLGLEDAA